MNKNQDLPKQNTPKPITDAKADHQDLYESYIQGHQGTFSKKGVIPAGFNSDKVSNFDRIVLKPDGEHFQSTYSKIGAGTAKGHTDHRRTFLLNHLLECFRRSEIRNSGGSDASFHVILHVDSSVSDLHAQDATKFLELLNTLRLMAFCDKVGCDLLSALSARALNSINTKTGTVVTQVQPATSAYSLQELQALTQHWLKNPKVATFCSWFSVKPGIECRCPFHDSAATDFAVGEHDEQGSLLCWGQSHCAKEHHPVHIPFVGPKAKPLSLANLILADTEYRKKWSLEFNKVYSHQVNAQRLLTAQKNAQKRGKALLIVSPFKADDDLLSEIRQILQDSHEVYQDNQKVLITLETNPVSGQKELRRHDSQEKFIALVSQFAVVQIDTEQGMKHGPLPVGRAKVPFHRADLRNGLPVLERLSRVPVLDIQNQRVQPPGYDLTTRVYYDGPPITCRTDGLTPMTDTMLSGWVSGPNRSCVGDGDIANMYGATFTEVLADTGLFNIHRHPVVKGNQKGLGKDKFGSCLSYLRENQDPEDLFHDDENRINQTFGNKMLEGRNVFGLSNIEVVGEYRNTLLTKWATMQELSGAKHGGGNWSRNPNTVTFILTLNKGKINRDLMDRLLPIELVIDGDARVRPFSFDALEFAKEHRLEIVAEILGLAILYLKNGQKPWAIPKDMDCRFKKWMQVVGALLELRGIHGFMSNTVRMESELDGQQQEFEELARRVFLDKGNTWLSAGEVLKYCVSGTQENPSGPALNFQELNGSKQPSKELAKYVLAPRVLKAINIEQDEAKPRQLVRLELQKNSNKHCNEYRFESVTGSAGVDRKNDTSLPSQPNTYSPNDLAPHCEGSEGKSNGGSIITNSNNININSNYCNLQESTLATLAPSQNSHEDPWGGAL